MYGDPPNLETGEVRPRVLALTGPGLRRGPPDHLAVLQS